MESYQPSRLGRYELLGKLATGGMAEIYLARLSGEAGFAKTCVVKRLLPELVASPAYVAMFLDEGKLVARIDHPNVCEVFELGRDGADYFLAMPFLDGVPVSALMAGCSPRIAAGVIVQACAGLQHAHELRGGDGELLGLVHRDVSPSNLFATTAGVVKVLDFGIAKTIGTAETELGTVKGKSQYMAPEQVLGERVDRRCDVFALGIVLWELATRQRLFRRDSEYLAARAILEEAIPRADEVAAGVPRQLADVAAKALARRREDRYATAVELAVAVAAAVAAIGGVATAAELAAAVVDGSGGELDAVRTRQARVMAAAETAERTLRVATPRAVVTDVEARPRGWAPRQSRMLMVVALIVGAALAWKLAMPHDNAASVAVGTGSATGAGAGSATGAGAGSATGAGSGAGSGSGSGSAEDIEIEAVGSATAPTRPPVTRPPRASGELSIDSTPYATIAIDGRAAGVTPLLHAALAAGHHRVHLTLRDGRSRDVDVDVPAGRAAAPIVARW